jgi:hypothetical protein
MSKRLFETDFWNGKYVRGLNKDENHLYGYLITNPQNTIAGIFDDQPDLFSMQTKIPQSDVETIISKLEGDGKLVRLPGDDKIALTKWGKHQSKSRDVVAGFCRVMSTLSEDSLNTLQHSLYTLPQGATWKIIRDGINKLQEGEPTYSKEDPLKTVPTESQRVVELNQTKPNQTPLGGGGLVDGESSPATAGTTTRRLAVVLSEEQLDDLDREFPDINIDDEYDRVNAGNQVRVSDPMAFMRARLKKITNFQQEVA